MKVTSFQAKTLPVCTFCMGEKEFQLILDFNSIAKIEDELGRNMSTIKDWQTKGEKTPDGLTASDITFICWATFDRYHPEMTLRELRQLLAPTDINLIWLMLIEMAIPGITEALEESAKLKATETVGEPGEQKPTPVV